MGTKYKKPISLEKKSPEKMICQNKGCDKMGRHLSVDDFYKSRNAIVQYHPFCKDCVNKFIDLNNLQTVYDVLKVLDTPFIMDEWEAICNLKPTNYIGSYLRIVNFRKRKKYEGWSFEDSIYELSEKEEVVKKEEEVIEEVEEVQEEIIEEEEIEEEEEIPTEPLVWNDEWQGKYTQSDLKYLNDYYNGLQNDFKIITTNHRDYAKKIAQASLSQMKAYQLLQAGKNGADLAYEKATKIFDMLSKSAQFAESQRGANDVALGCFGRVFDAVEKHNWVPDYVPTDEDMYDKLLKQFSNIERSL